MADELNASRVPESRCPSCFKLGDAATEIRNQLVQPQPGDFSICWNCGALLRFDADLTTVLAADMSELTDEQRREVERAQASIRGRRSPGASNGR